MKNENEQNDGKLPAAPRTGNHILNNALNDGVDRRGFLKCMAWAGTGMLWAASGGVLGSRVLGPVSAFAAEKPGAGMGDFSFVQISDSHIGFNKEANKDVLGTLKEAVARINALPAAPDFLLHTGDLTHLSEPEEFDTLEQILKSCKAKQVFYVPGEHDVLNDNGKQYLERFGKGAKGHGWYSFDHKGTHFVGLNNVMAIREGGLGQLGDEQLKWMEDDLKAVADSTAVVVFAHVPLWMAYPQWGWGTEDGARARLPETIWFAHGSQRAHPPGAQKDRGQRDVPHGDVHRFSTTRTRLGAEARPHESGCRQIARRARHHRGELQRRPALAGGCGRNAWLIPMDAHFWQRLHGGSTHFPIVLLLVSVGMDAAALRSRDEQFRRGLHAAGLASAVVGALGGCGAVVTGLFLSNGRLLGSGFERNHHLFVWPAFGLCLVLVASRLWLRGRISRRGLAMYLGGMGVASALMMGAGYWGGEMLLGVEPKDVSGLASQQPGQPPSVARGRELFQLNCAHCHGDDARGTDEGPDLAGLKKSDTRIASLITNGIKGEMPRFGSKLREEDIHELIRFLHSLKTG